jgi:L-ribulose-5-phosphate 4-epimerase
MAGKDVSDIKEQVALANRTLHHEGLTTYLGHASARIPGTDRIIIKPRPHVSMDRVTAGMLMTLDLEGNIIDAPKGAIIPAEWSLHTEIYKARSDVNGVVHTHQKWCTMFGIAGVTILPVHHPGHASSVVPPYPIYEESYAIVTEVQQAKVVAEILGDAVGCHLRTHGMVFVGSDVHTAASVAKNAEHQAEMNWLAMQVGDRETIPMLFMRGQVEGRANGNEESSRDGVYPSGRTNEVWADQNREVLRKRVVQL